MTRRQFIKRNGLWVAAGALGFPRIIRGAHPAMRARQVKPPTAAGGGGSPSFIEAMGTDFTTTASPLISYPVPSTVNDVWLAFFGTQSVHSTLTAPPTGWTKLHEVDVTGQLSVSSFWKRTDGTEDSLTWTDIFTSPQSGRCIIVNYRGCTTSGSPVDASNTEIGTAGTAQDTPSVTTTVANTRVVGIFGIDPVSGTPTFTWDGGITERIDSDTAVVGNNTNIAAFYIGDKEQASAGALTLGGDFSSSETPAELVYALKP